IRPRQHPGGEVRTIERREDLRESGFVSRGRDQHDVDARPLEPPRRTRGDTRTQRSSRPPGGSRFGHAPVHRTSCLGLEASRRSKASDRVRGAPSHPCRAGPSPSQVARNAPPTRTMVARWRGQVERHASAARTVRPPPYAVRPSCTRHKEAARFLGTDAPRLECFASGRSKLRRTYEPVHSGQPTFKSRKLLVDVVRGHEDTHKTPHRSGPFFAGEIPLRLAKGPRLFVTI